MEGRETLYSVEVSHKKGYRPPETIFCRKCLRTGYVRVGSESVFGHFFGVSLTTPEKGRDHEMGRLGSTKSSVLATTDNEVESF